ncbi:hypothetical protein ACP70R_048660 [Stipagrostis hirtigluma subsp. patula]
MAIAGFHQDSMAAMSINHNGGLGGKKLRGVAAAFDRDNALDGKDLNQDDITGLGINHNGITAGKEQQHNDVDGSVLDHNGALPRGNNSTNSGGIPGLGV